MASTTMSKTPQVAGPPRPSRRRERFLPRTVLGITALVLAASLGAALSGTVLYAYYQYRLTTATQRINTYVKGFDQRYQTALATIAAQRDNATAQIQDTLAPLLKSQAQGATLAALLKQAAPSLWFVHTLDANGQPAAGTAFAVASTSAQTLLLASYTTIQAATHEPSAPIYVRKNGQDQLAHLQGWSAKLDLALLILPQGNQPTLTFAPSSPALTVGDQIFALSGLGTAGGAITAGQVADVSADAIQHDAPVGTAFQGGPLLDAKGQVVGVASRSYAPLGFPSDGVWFGVPIRMACSSGVLSCPGGAPSG